MSDEASQSRKPQIYDRVYKRVFSHRRVVADMLEYLLPPEIYKTLDLTTLKECSNELVTGDLERRVADSVWEVQVSETTMLVLIEFQSTVDADMVSRMLSYVTMLRDKWIRTTGHGKTPPLILPVVIYGGDGEWATPTDSSIQLPPCDDWLGQFQVHLKYVVIRMQQSDPPGPGTNAFVYMIRVISARNEHEFNERAAEADHAVATGAWSDTLFEEISQWQAVSIGMQYIKDTYLRKQNTDIQQTEETDMAANLAIQRVAEIEARISDEVLEIGREEGLEIGRKEGEEIGWKKGVEEGIAIGRRESDEK